MRNAGLEEAQAGIKIARSEEHTSELQSHTTISYAVFCLQYVNRELPDVQAGFRKGRGTRDQIANIHWIMEKAREFQKNMFLLY